MENSAGPAARTEMRHPLTKWVDEMQDVLRAVTTLMFVTTQQSDGRLAAASRVCPERGTGRSSDVASLDALAEVLELVISDDEQCKRCLGSSLPGHLPYRGPPGIECLE